MKNIKQYYKELGKIVYAVAIADGKINPEEITTLHEFVAKELAANENAVDSSGMNEAFYVDFEFEESIRKNLTIETAIKSYAKFIHVKYEGDKFNTWVADTELEERKVAIKTKAILVSYALSKIWGGDVLTIGYGISVEMYDELSLEKNLDIVCVRLMTRYPIARKDLFRFPVRALKYYLQSPSIASLWLKQKISLKPYVNKFPFNERDHWISYNKCDLCKVCKIPEVF